MELTANRLGKRYGQNWAVEDFDTTFTPGVYALIGPNGSGKTTLIRMLVNILKPTLGRILFNGKDIANLDEQYRDILGYLPQHLGLYKNFTAEQFLMYISALKGLDKKYALKKTNELMETVNLKEAGRKKIGQFSGGMKQRLGIAQALLNDPKILILDEPTAGLDPKERIRFRNLIAEIAGGKIVILSTHIVSDAEYIAGEIMFMKNGFLLQKGQPSALLKTLEGKVWQTQIREEDLQRLKETYRVGHIVRTNSCLDVRLFAEMRPSFAVSPTTLGLEDLYLYHFDETDKQRETGFEK